MSFSNRQSSSFVIAILLCLARSINAVEADGDCVPIYDLFGENGVYEMNVNGTNIGNATGAIDLWSDNPLRAGSIDGEIVGKISGRCTLLPGELFYFCNGIMKFAGNDTITYTGLSPNSLEEGRLTFTGGTGCYEGANGSLLLTPQDDEYGSWLWKYRMGTVSSTCVPINELVGDGIIEANTGGATLGDYETAGSKDLWAGNSLTNSDGEEIGKSYGECTLLTFAEAFMCNIQWVLESGNVITFSGYSPNSMDTGTIAITGGTDCYSSASATLTLTPADENYKAYAWKYMAPPNPEECKSLVETLGGNPLIYEENTGAETIGKDFETAGTLDLWYGSILRSGSQNGTRVAESTLGECILLTNATEFLCLGQFLIDSNLGSTIIYTGFSPNSLEGGTMAIVGGTGCFNGIKGEITLTAQAFETEYDFFTHEIKSTNEAASSTVTDVGDEILEGAVHDENEIDNEAEEPDAGIDSGTDPAPPESASSTTHAFMNSVPSFVFIVIIAFL